MSKERLVYVVVIKIYTIVWVMSLHGVPFESFAYSFRPHERNVELQEVDGIIPAHLDFASRMWDRQEYRYH